MWATAVQYKLVVLPFGKIIKGVLVSRNKPICTLFTAITLFFRTMAPYQYSSPAPDQCTACCIMFLKGVVALGSTRAQTLLLAVFASLTESCQQQERDLVRALVW